MKLLHVSTCVLLLPFLSAAQMVQSVASPPANTAEPQGFLGNYGKPINIFPDFWKPYIQKPIAMPVLENSSRLGSLIHDGKLELSVADAVALTLENNLDIVVARYTVPFSQIDIMRTKSGQAARGFTGALSPGELNSGAIGAGVTNAGGAGGTGNAGGITGGGGAVSVGAAGAFDPSVSFGFSYDHVTSPLNSLVVSGIPTTVSEATSLSFSYAQAFTNGASYSVSFSGLRQGTTQQNTLFNPDVTSRLSIGFNQPLLNSRGYLPNMRFMFVARTNLGTAMEVFRQQVITSVATMENSYWDLAAFQLNVQVAQNSLTVSKALLEENRKQEEIGTMSQLDVVTAESQVAAANRDLILAQTALEQQVTTVKQLISKKDDAALDAATIVVTDQMPLPRESDLPDMRSALDTAHANRPEVKEAVNNLQNQDVAIQYTRNNQLPTFSVFGLAAGAGLNGNTALANGGAAGSLAQTFSAAYPEGAFGATFSAVIRNRSAQADSARAQLERNQLQVGLQNTRNQISMQVQQARISLIQGKSQVEAAQEAVRLAQLTLDGERKKLEVGISTSYNVVLRERDLVTAQYAEVEALDAYAKALVALDQATGATLDRNGIQLNDALGGTVTEKPVSPFHSDAPRPQLPPAAGVNR